MFSLYFVKARFFFFKELNNVGFRFKLISIVIIIFVKGPQLSNNTAVIARKGFGESLTSLACSVRKQFTSSGGREHKSIPIA